MYKNNLGVKSFNNAMIFKNASSPLGCKTFDIFPLRKNASFNQTAILHTSVKKSTSSFLEACFMEHLNFSFFIRYKKLQTKYLKL